MCDPGTGVMEPLQRHYSHMPLIGAFYAGSVYMFYRKRFRIDNNFVNFLGFSAAACPASIVFANTFAGNTEIEAGLLNNEKE